jgi:hypothetical protein
MTNTGPFSVGTGKLAEVAVPAIVNAVLEAFGTAVVANALCTVTTASATTKKPARIPADFEKLVLIARTSSHALKRIPPFLDGG